VKSLVSVIGAGTAGLIAARELSLRGIETSVHDQKEIPGRPASASGIFSIGGINNLGINYRKSLTNTLYGARFHAGKEVMEVRSKEPQAYVLDREELNSICIDEAEDAGATINLGRRVAGNELGEMSEGGIVIGADGAASAVASYFKMGSIDEFILTYKAEYRTRIDDAGMVDLFFDGNYAPGFFGWLCPNSDSVMEVGIGVSMQNGNAKAYFDKFAGSERIRKVLGNAEFLKGGASMIPIRLRKRIFDEERNVVLVGDAAGQVKPSTGGGIVFGGNAAKMAAEAVANRILRGGSLEQYAKSYKKKYMIDTKLHGLARSIYTRDGILGMEGMLKIMKALRMEKFLAEYGDMDMPSVVPKRFLLSVFGKA
jgi:geranylgeranyl reductase family protein